MYDKDEKLITLENIKYGKTEIQEGTEVTFIKAVDSKDDITKSIVLIQYEDKIIPVLELKVRPKDVKKIDNAYDTFNKMMYKNNPRLRMYHPNFFVRTFFKIYYFIFKDKDVQEV